MKPKISFSLVSFILTNFSCFVNFYFAVNILCMQAGHLEEAVMYGRAELTRYFAVKAFANLLGVSLVARTVASEHSIADIVSFFAYKLYGSVIA